MNKERLTEAGAANLRSNLQKAQTARALALMTSGRDFDKHANGVNSTLGEALVGDLDAKTVLTRETPAHRTMINMAAAGYTNREIAAAVGRSPTTVANTIRQPWAREYLIKEAKKTVQDEIKTVLEAEALPSIRRLVQIRDSSLETAADRNASKAACDSLLDRFLGKPTQPITTDAKPMAELSDEELREQVIAELSVNKPN